MPNRITRHSAVAALELLSDGVLIVRLTGPLTGDALMAVKTGILADYSHAQIRGFVVDYTGAAVALTGEQLDQVLEGEADRVPGLPAAMICRPECNSLFKGHALRMAGKHAITRRVFNEAEPALAWVREAAQRLSQ